MFAILKDAFTAAFKKPITWVALIAIPAIVACFAFLYVSTFIDPFERMKDLPIAVICEDEGTEVNNGWRNYGNELVDSIMEDDSALWTREDASILNDGIESTDYFLAVIIPHDFSQRVAAGQTSAPQQANITFFRNARKNYMLSTLSSRIESALSNTVNGKVSEQYISAYVGGLETASKGMESAAEGASSLSSGLSAAHDGSNSLNDGLSALNDGCESLQTGNNQVARGAQELAGAIDSGTTGAKKLAEATSALKNGTNSLVNQNSDLISGSQSIANALSQLDEGAKVYSETLATSKSEIAAPYGGDPTTALPQAQEQFGKALQTYATDIALAAKTGQDPSLVDTSDVTAAAATIAAISSQASAYQALGTASSGFQSLEDGVEEASANYATLDSGIENYTASVAAIASGAEQIDDAAQQLAIGTAQLQSASSSLANGASRTASGVSELRNGIQSAAQGTSELSEGLESTKNGANTLANSLSEGSDTIESALTAPANDLAHYAANPVAMQDDAFGDLPSFGYGFAPMFLTLCLWLGSLMLFFIFEPFPSSGKLANKRLAVVIGRWPLYLVLVVLNVAIIFIGAIVLDIPRANTAIFCALLAITAVSFTAIMQLLNMFDIPGKAVSVLFVIIQLVCCSGTFPAQLGNDAAAAIGPMLPFHYAIDGIREIMSGNDLSVAYMDMGILALFGIGAIALSLVVYPVALKFKRKLDSSKLKALHEFAE